MNENNKIEKFMIKKCLKIDKINNSSFDYTNQKEIIPKINELLEKYSFIKYINENASIEIKIIYYINSHSYFLIELSSPIQNSNSIPDDQIIIKIVYRKDRGLDKIISAYLEG